MRFTLLWTKSCFFAKQRGSVLKYFLKQPNQCTYPPRVASYTIHFIQNLTGTEKRYICGNCMICIMATAGKPNKCPSMPPKQKRCWPVNIYCYGLYILYRNNFIYLDLIISRDYQLPHPQALFYFGTYSKYLSAFLSYVLWGMTTDWSWTRSHPSIKHRSIAPSVI